MQAKQLVGAAVFGLGLGFTGMVHAGGVTDAATGAIRESVHEKADSAMDSVGLGKEKAAAEGAATDAKPAAGETAASAAEGDAAKKAAAAEGDAAKDAVAKDAESAKGSAGDATPAAPEPPVEDAAKETAKGALKGLLD